VAEDLNNLISAFSGAPGKALVFGMAPFPAQIKNLAIFVACVNLIVATSSGLRESTVALGLALVVFAIPVVALICLYAARPQPASKALMSSQTWMVRHNRSITVVLCFVFGALFLIRNLSGA
jgi:hypothetical protein